MAKLFYFSLAFVSFAIGAYAWKINSTGLKPVEAPEPLDEDSGGILNPTLIIVGGSPLTKDDVEWAYSLHTIGIVGSTEYSAASNLGQKVHQELSPLKQSLLAQLVERTLLYKYIEQDPRFDLGDPQRFTKCLSEWQETLAYKGAELGPGNNAHDRLKTMLCEQDLIRQYMTEVIFASTSVSQQEVAEFYKDNHPTFRKPQRAVVRQILLAKEGEAKKVSYKVNRDNFQALASELSISPESADGGLMKPYAKGTLPDVFDAAFRMRRGEISPILKSTYGFHIIMLEQLLPAAELSLEQASDEIAKTLLKKKQEKEFETWVEKALNTVRIQMPEQLW